MKKITNYRSNVQTFKSSRLVGALLGGFLFLALNLEPLNLERREAMAHPGRLDKDGCHEVHEDYEYESGQVLKKGTRHCHRGLDKMRFDGKELLDDPKDEGMPSKEKRRIERRGFQS